MKTERNKKKGRQGEKEEEEPKERGGADGKAKVLHAEVPLGSHVPFSPRPGFRRSAYEAELSKAIDETLRQIEETRQQTRAHDEEMARLREETRRLIDEMLRDLNLKAA